MAIKLKNVLNTFFSAYEKFDKDIIYHCKEVAYISLEICKELNLDEDTKKNIVLASYFHDISASKTNYFETLKTFETFKYHSHCIYGYVFFKVLVPSNCFSEYILYHHESFDSKNKINGIDIPLESNIIKLADDISLFNFLNNDIDINKLINYLNENKSNYNPLYLDILLSDKGRVILNNLLNKSYMHIIDNFGDDILIPKPNLINYAELIAFILDFKCEVTSIHSQTVALFSLLLAKKFNLDKNTLIDIQIASLLHDIGKLGIDDTILKKPNRLNKEEFCIMKNHAKYTYEILSNLENNQILNIASNHHEKLNGIGYPRSISNLTLPERIVCVADIFAALTQKRTYKDGFNKEKTIHILKSSAENGELDYNIVNIIMNNYDFFIEENLNLYKAYNNKINNLKNNFNLLVSSL